MTKYEIDDDLEFLVIRRGKTNFHVVVPPVLVEIIMFLLTVVRLSEDDGDET